MSMFVNTDLSGAKDRAVPETRGLRILMVAPQPWFRPRGTPFSVLHRIRALLGAGHRVDLVTYPFGEDVPMRGLRIFRAPRPLCVRDVRIGPSIPKIFLDLKLHQAARRLLAVHRYEILHTHEEAAFFGVGLARRHHLLHVYDMHSSLPHQLSNFRAYDLGLLRAYFRRQERRVLTSANGIITICEDLATIARKDCGATPHAMIENTGDDGRVFPAETEEVRASLGFGDAPLVLYTGTLEAYQGIDLLLDAFAGVVSAVARAKLVLAGGRPEQIEHFRKRTQALGLDDSVRFTGSVHPTRVAAFLRVADLIVSPRSRGTNTPLKIYSYMRSGVPLVATDRPTHTQTLTHETACLVPATVEGFAAGMRRMLDHPEEARRLGDAALRFAREHFSDAEYCRKVTEFYERVLAAAKR